MKMAFKSRFLYNLAKKVKYEILYIAYFIRESFFRMYFFINMHNAGVSNQCYQGKVKIIVSLTSYPKRFSKVYLAIESILLQSIRPNKVILYLGDDSKEAELPKKILKLKKYGLKIERRKNNLKPHTKYYYAFQEYPEDIVITIDDDLIYEKDMIKLLVKSYEKYPKAISARRVHRMLKDKDGNILPYNKWDFEYKKCLEPSMSLFATGCGGVLYPPHSINLQAYDQEAIINYCINQDDIWLKYMELLQNTPVVFVPGKKQYPVPIAKSIKGQALSKSNVLENMNDVCIKNMEYLYGISLVDFSVEID